MKASRVVVLGEALLDVVDGDEQPGGAPLNVAVGVARLGRRVAWAGPVGADHGGQLIREHLNRAGVEADLVEEVDRPTARAVVRFDEDGQPTYEFEIDGTSCGAASDRALSLADASMLSVTAGAVAFDRVGLGRFMAERVRAAKVPVWLDPNIRPGTFTDPLSYAALVDALVADSAMVKASTEDLGLLWPGEDPASVAERWVGSGPGLVVLTDGAKGMTAFVGGGRRVHQAALTTEVVDTVGAGDATMAALIAWADASGAQSGAELRALPDIAVAEALRRAAHAAAITCGRRGAQPPTLGELNASEASLEG